jgi:hypothetical protein
MHIKVNKMWCCQQKYWSQYIQKYNIKQHTKNFHVYKAEYSRCRSNDVPADAMKTYRGPTGIAPPILNLGTRRKYKLDAPAAFPPVPIE